MLDSTVDDAVYNVDDVTTPASIMHQVTICVWLCTGGLMIYYRSSTLWWGVRLATGIELHPSATFWADRPPRSAFVKPSSRRNELTALALGLAGYAPAAPTTWSRTKIIYEKHLRGDNLARMRASLMDCECKLCGCLHTTPHYGVYMRINSI